MLITRCSFLFYGIILKNKHFPWQKLDILDWDDYLARKNNIYRENMDIDDFYDLKKRCIRKYGVVIDFHGSLDNELDPIVYIRSSLRVCPDDDIVTVNQLVIGKRWDRKLRSFLKVMDIPHEYKKPNWYLANF